MVDSATSGDPVSSVDEAGEAITEAELREFLAADPLPAPADPAFKRKLQSRLWEIVQARLEKKRSDKRMHGWRRRDVSPEAEPGPGTNAKRKRGPA